MTSGLVCVCECVRCPVMVVTSHPGPAFPGFSASPTRIEDGISESLGDVHNFVADFRRKREKKKPSCALFSDFSNFEGC